MKPEVQAAIKSLMEYQISEKLEKIVFDAIKLQVQLNTLSFYVPYPFHTHFEDGPRYKIETTSLLGFYPNMMESQPNNLTKFIVDHTVLGPPLEKGQNLTHWHFLCNAIICQCIYYLCPTVTNVRGDKVNRDVQNYNEAMMKNIGLIGASAVSMEATVAGLGKAAVDAGTTTDDYTQYIISTIPSYISLFNSGNWTNGYEDIFEWIGKYLSIGGIWETIDTFLEELYKNDLPKFPELTGIGLNSFNAYIRNNINGISYKDFPDLMEALPMGYGIEEIGGGKTDKPKSCGYLYFNYNPLAFESYKKGIFG